MHGCYKFICDEIDWINAGFLLGAGNRLFLLPIQENVTGYRRKNVSEIIETTFKIHCTLKKLILFWEFLFHNTGKHPADNITLKICSL